MRAGPGEGRSKLLMALTLSTDSALRFHYDSPAESSIDKGAGKGSPATYILSSGFHYIASYVACWIIFHSKTEWTAEVIMTASLADIFKEEKVHPDLAAELSKVLTIHSFACIASSAEHLEECIKEAVATTLHSLLTPVCIACLKASYHRCLTNLVAPGASAPAQPASLTASSSWTDTFPAKLGNEKVATLRSKFEADYPSEILDASTMPSSRLLASVNKQCQDKRYTYVAWKHRISEEKLEDMHSSRPRKVARFDDFIFDEVPSREIPESGISQMFLLHLLDLVAFAFCLLEAAHLSSFRAYSKLFLKLAFQKQAADSGLRSPNVHEMQWADKEAWRCISDLANSGWSLDDALHEVVQVDEGDSSGPSGQVFPSHTPSASAGHTSTSSEEILQILQGTFLEGMTKWRSHAISSTSPLAAYYNLGAFSQSVRLGLTNATFQYRNVLCRLNSWLSMLFPLGTWSSLCISHNELLKFHRDCTNEANTLNYTVTLGNFTGGGLLLESEAGDHSHFVEELNRRLNFCLVDTHHNPLAFDGNLWHGTAPFQGDRWVITAYTCRNLDKFRAEDIKALRSWGFPLPQSDAPPTIEVIPSPSREPSSLPSKFCLWLGSIAPADRAKLSMQSVPLISVADLHEEALRKQVLRCAADGVFSVIFIRFSSEWSENHNMWVLQLCKLAFSCGATVHLDISTWNNCWHDPLFIHCVATGFRHVVQIPPCAFQGKAGRPWILVSSSEAFASLGEVCMCKRCLHHSENAPYTASLIEAFGKFFLSAFDNPAAPGATFSIQEVCTAVLTGVAKKELARSRLLSPCEENLFTAEAAADAMGNGSTFAVGGYIALPAREFWFSAHKDISCYECLGQIALVWSWKPNFPLPTCSILGAAL
ncbi:unnamed protein product [Symbiodinium microadriaticum]|nr:unnamed protein product [Symbiodinium microadriaticum]